MDDDREFPPIDAEQARSLLVVAYQGIRTAIDRNGELAGVLERQEDDEARRLNDAVFVALNDVRQRFEAVIGRAS